MDLSTDTIKICRELHRKVEAFPAAPDAINILHIYDPSMRNAHKQSLSTYAASVNVVSDLLRQMALKLRTLNQDMKLIRTNVARAQQPIYALPNEVLYLIFEMVCFSAPVHTTQSVIYNTEPDLQKATLTLSKVCVQWHEILRQHQPELFARLSFCSDTTKFAQLAPLLACSGSQPLDLRLYQREDMLANKYDMAPVDLSKRLRTLSVDYPIGYGRFFQKLDIHNGPRLPPQELLPILESVCISSDGTPVKDTVCDDLLALPVLKSLTFATCPTPTWLPTFFTSGGSLSSLTLKSTRIWPSELGNILGTNPCIKNVRLEKLACYLVAPNAPDHVVTRVRPCVGVRRLEIVDCSPRFVTAMLKGRYTSLEHFTLDLGNLSHPHARGQDDAPVEPDSSDENCGLDHLHDNDLSWRDEEWAGWGSWRPCYGLFSDLFKSCERLKSLDLCGQPVVLTHVLELLRLPPIKWTELSHGSGSPYFGSQMPGLCPSLRDVKIRFSRAHRRFTSEQIRPLHNALCALLDRALPLPEHPPSTVSLFDSLDFECNGPAGEDVAALYDTIVRPPPQYMHVTIPSCMLRGREAEFAPIRPTMTPGSEATPPGSRYIVESIPYCIWRNMCNPPVLESSPCITQ